MLDDVPRALPALDRSKKLQKTACRLGFDWKSLAPVIAKLKEEIVELEEAIAKRDNEQISAELGDVLFSAVNVARHIKIDPEISCKFESGNFFAKVPTAPL